MTGFGGVFPLSSVLIDYSANGLMLDSYNGSIGFVTGSGSVLRGSSTMLVALVSATIPRPLLTPSASHQQEQQQRHH